MNAAGNVPELEAHAPGTRPSRLSQSHGADEYVHRHTISQREAFANTRRSAPVISFGSLAPRIPSSVGEISRKDPFGFSVNCFESSATTMKGTGFVVCAVCG